MRPYLDLTTILDFELMSQITGVVDWRAWNFKCVCHLLTKFSVLDCNAGYCFSLRASNGVGALPLASVHCSDGSKTRSVEPFDTYSPMASELPLPHPPRQIKLSRCLKTWPCVHSFCRCGSEYTEEDRLLVEHHCTDKKAWAVGEALASTSLQRGATPLSLEDMKSATERIVDVASLFSHKLFSPEFLLWSQYRGAGELAELLQVGRRIVYRRELFKGACKFQHQLKP